MMQTGQFVHSYLGSPDMNMAKIASGYGVDGEVVASPQQLKDALARARKAGADGKPYLIDAQIRRGGSGWAEKPWTPTVKMASSGMKRS
jgi:thiamine pyrophosphate-dependent acetolactate synthase large subunit-like protein